MNRRTRMAHLFRIRRVPVWMLLFWALLGGRSAALDPDRQVTQYGLRSWGPDDGLPTGTVRALAQDADGWLWVGTDEGLARFDGVRFSRPADKGAAEPRVRQVSALAAAPDGALWIGTAAGGLLRWRQGRLAPAEGTLGASGLAITALALDRDGVLWVGTRQRGIYRLDANTLAHVTAADGLPTNQVSALTTDPQGGVWVSTADGRLSRWTAAGAGPPIVPGPGPAHSVRMAMRDRTGGLWLGVSGSEMDELFGDFMYSVSVRHPGGGSYDLTSFTPGVQEEPVLPLSMLEDRRGPVWIGTRKGLLRVSEGRMEILSAGDGLPDDGITCLLEDREGNLWIGTRLGVARLRDEAIVAFRREQGLRGERVFAVSEGANGDIWVGTDGGPSKIAGGRVIPFKPRQLGGTMVYDILRAPGGHLYLATRRGVAWAHDARLAWLGGGASADVVHALCLDRAGRLWAGTASRGVIGYRGGVPLPVRPPADPALRKVRDLACGPDGVVWAATRGGLARLRGGTLEAVPAASVGTAGELACLHVDAAGAVWAGTVGGGLLLVRDGVTRRITVRQGLWHDTVLCILEDEAGDVWMASPQGIFRAPKARLEAVAGGRADRVECIRYGTDDGMRSVECLPGGCRGSDGRLWLCTVRGLCVVEPALLRTPPPAPAVRWLEVSADGRLASPGRVELGPEVRELEVRFAALHYRAPERIRFRARLEGFDREWSAPFAERSVRYAPLPPGSYTLRVQSRLPGGGWGGEAAGLAVTVRPPLWRTGWFQALALAALVLGVLAGRAGFVRLRELVREWRLTHSVGPYRLVEVLGRGGMGTVWRAVHRRSGREAAVKIVEAAAGDGMLRERFLREGLACERIDHPAVVRVFERGEDRDRLWYAMEMCRGRSLRAILGDGGLPPGRAAAICREILEAVRAIHAAGVIHRDLKPDNIVLEPSADGTGTARVRILDFGLARLSDRRTRTGQGFPAGTLAYLPPEYLGSGGREDAAVDRYAVGVILYEMLTGAPPFAEAADDPAAMLYTLLHEDPVPPAEIDPAIPAGLSELALRMIARSPSDRPDSVEDLLRALCSLSLSLSVIDSRIDCDSDSEKR